jgi:hypothetical protein
VPDGNERSPAQIREQIRAERAQLDAALAGPGADAKRTAVRAASAFAGLAGLVVLRRLLRRR